MSLYNSMIASPGFFGREMCCEKQCLVMGDIIAKAPRVERTKALPLLYSCVVHFLDMLCRAAVLPHQGK